MIRIRQYNPKRVFKYKPIKLQSVARKEIEYSIDRWWQERLKAGCQLANGKDYQHKYDYRGDGPWFTHVATRALYQNYLLSPDHVLISTGTFLRYFYKLTNHPKRITMPSQLMSKGQKFLRPRRCFVRFKEWDYYAGLNFQREVEAINEQFEKRIGRNKERTR